MANPAFPSLTSWGRTRLRGYVAHSFAARLSPPAPDGERKVCPLSTFRDDENHLESKHSPTKWMVKYFLKRRKEKSLAPVQDFEGRFSFGSRKKFNLI